MAVPKIDGSQRAFVPHLDESGEHEPISEVRDRFSQGDHYHAPAASYSSTQTPISGVRRKPVRGPSISTTPQLTVRHAQDITFQLLAFLGAGGAMESPERAAVREATAHLQSVLADYQEMGSVESCLRVIAPLCNVADASSEIMDLKSKSELAELREIQIGLYTYTKQVLKDARSLFPGRIDQNTDRDLHYIAQHAIAQLSYLQNSLQRLKASQQSSSRPAQSAGGGSSNVVAPAAFRPTVPGFAGGMAAAGGGQGPFYRAPIAPPMTPLTSAMMLCGKPFMR